MGYDAARLLGIRRIPRFTVYNSGKQGTTVHTFVLLLVGVHNPTPMNAPCWSGYAPYGAMKTGAPIRGLIADVLAPRNGAYIFVSKPAKGKPILYTATLKITLLMFRECHFYRLERKVVVSDLFYCPCKELWEKNWRICNNLDFMRVCGCVINTRAFKPFFWLRAIKNQREEGKSERSAAMFMPAEIFKRKYVYFLLERVQPSDGAGEDDPQEDVEGEAHLHEVLEFVAPRVVHVRVGLVADGGGKAGAGAEHD